MNDRTVEWTVLDGLVVSTVRLTIDHGFGEKPLWYETMVFPHDGTDVTSFGDLYCDRYTSEEEAQAGHDALVAQLQSGDRSMLYGQGVSDEGVRDDG